MKGKAQVEIPGLFMRQPNSWSCYPTCLSMMSGQTLETIYSIIGHDGSETWPGRPLNKRCFTGTEIILAAYYLEMALVALPVAPFVDEGLDNQTLLRMLNTHDAILAGISTVSGHAHAIYWSRSRQCAIDPRDGLEYSYSDILLTIEVVFIWMKF